MNRFITRIEYEDRPEPVISYHSMIKQSFDVCDPLSVNVSQPYNTEIVKAYLYMYGQNGECKKVSIGMTNKVSDIIGLPMNTVSDMSMQIISMTDDKQKLEKNIQSLNKLVSQTFSEINDIRFMNFWSRLKFLFGAKI